LTFTNSSFSSFSPISKSSVSSTFSAFIGFLAPLLMKLRLKYYWSIEIGFISQL
jgi:hypothetical protein